MNFKDAMKKCLEHTLHSIDFEPLTLIQLSDEKILVTKSGRVFKGSTSSIFQLFLEAVLIDIQSYYIYVKAEGQIVNEPKGASLKPFQKEFLLSNFDLKTHVEQLMGHAFFHNICSVKIPN